MRASHVVLSRGSLGETFALTRGEFSGPVTYPAILYAVERVSTSPLAVRLPALVFSLLAVAMMLGFVAIDEHPHRTVAAIEPPDVAFDCDSFLDAAHG